MYFYTLQHKPDLNLNDFELNVFFIGPKCVQFEALLYNSIGNQFEYRNWSFVENFNLFWCFLTFCKDIWSNPSFLKGADNWPNIAKINQNCHIIVSKLLIMSWVCLSIVDFVQFALFSIKNPGIYLPYYWTWKLRFVPRFRFSILLAPGCF